MKRIVLDSNILISAFFWEGRERDLLRRCKKSEIELVSSPFILEEVGKVLEQKFNVNEQSVHGYVREIFKTSHVVFVRGIIQEIQEDPSDNYILETAVNGKADVIVTGDKHLLKIHDFKDIVICKAKDLDNE